MGFFDFLVGGQKSEPLWSDSQKWLQNLLVGQVAGQMGKGVEAYGGQIAPDASGNQQLAFDQAGGLLGGGGIDTRPAIERYLSGDPAYQIDPAESARQFDLAVGAPARQDFGDALRTLDTRYGARFGRSGSQLEAAGRAAERFGTGLMGERANWMRADEMDRRQALERGLDRMGAGVGMAYGTDANTRANLGTVATLGGMERGITGEQLAEDYGKWEYSRPYNNPWLGFMGTALTPEPRQQQYQPGFLSGALSGGLMGAKLGGPWGAAAGAAGGGLLSAGGWF